ncbi:ATP-binding cassette domain-containing protein [Roseobacter sp. N2S]|uniref:ABC transporter ATP-binding protein n=1 Tax=Roseobacter sp. N2S TaxID=2663844 RepID=UPI00285B7B2E|nr:ATP-binding cassette domain-containing protein [Roseobacter sp. N2S]MDR6266782.1 branched-chain amino acid transport system ATP-binding protein [Roseobacter sp. N2S]
MTRLLDVSGLKVGYGAMPVLHGIDIHLDAGEPIGLFGPNGHGKTTLLRAVSGLLRPTEGRIMFDGKDITGAKPSAIVAAGVVHAQQGNTMFGDMGVEETLELSAFNPRAREGWKDRLIEVHTLFPRLAERRRQQAKTLSGGERQMLSIGCAMMCNPRLLILDEPTLGLSPRLKGELRDAIASIAEKGIPLIVVEQDVEFLLSLSSRLYLIEQGEVTNEIDKANAPDHQEIMDMYFGEGAH